MRSFKQFLLEGERSKAISFNEAIKIARSNCQDILHGESKIYRGIRVGANEYMYAEPSKFERKSANTSNHYTEIIDNAENWSKYPDRSKSLICTNSLSIAGDYGIEYYVLPFDGSKIGIVPEDDFWRGFKSGVESIFSDSLDLSVFNFMLSNLMKSVYNYLKSNITKPEPQYSLGDSWEDIKNFSEQISTLDIEDLLESITFENPFDDLQKDLLIAFKNSDYSYLIEWLQKELFDPKLNGFKIMNTKQYADSNFSSRREVWTDGNSILIDAAQWDNFKDSI